MHELVIAENLLRLVEERAKTDNFLRVEKLVLRIGHLSHVSIDALQFCFDAVTADTIAAGATLEIEREPAMAYCSNCQETAPAEALIDACPLCGAIGRKVVSGRDIILSSLQVTD